MKKEERVVLFFMAILVLTLAVFNFDKSFGVNISIHDSDNLESVSNKVTESTGGSRYVCNINSLNSIPVQDTDIHVCGLNQTGCCFGDVDGNGVVTAGDRGLILANFGRTDGELICRYDLDGNGVITPADRGYVSANIGFCSRLPDYQNGSGCRRGDCPDTRFPEECSVPEVPIYQISFTNSTGTQIVISPSIMNFIEEISVNFSILNTDPSVTYEWNFGSCFGEGGWSEGNLTNYIFSRVGTQVVSLVARNNCGNSVAQNSTYNVISRFPLTPIFQIYRQVGEGRNGCFGSWTPVSPSTSYIFSPNENIKFGGVTSTGSISNATWQFKRFNSTDIFFADGQEVIQGFGVPSNYSANLTIQRIGTSVRNSLVKNFIVG